jgi:hypothetical protein
VLNDSPVVASVIVTTNALPLKFASAVMWSPGWIVIPLMMKEGWGKNSNHAKYVGAPFWQSESVPVCSTVPELNPSMPTQKDENWLVLGHDPWIVGTIHDPLASLTEPGAPVTAYPLQFVLFELALCARGASANCGTGTADAVIRKERAINAAAVAVERDNVCGFIFNNGLATNNLDKICGQQSSQTP